MVLNKTKIVIFLNGKRVETVVLVAVKAEIFGTRSKVKYLVVNLYEKLNFRTTKKTKQTKVELNILSLWQTPLWLRLRRANILLMENEAILRHL